MRLQNVSAGARRLILGLGIMWPSAATAAAAAAACACAGLQIVSIAPSNALCVGNVVKSGIRHVADGRQWARNCIVGGADSGGGVVGAGGGDCGISAQVLIAVLVAILCCCW